MTWVLPLATPGFPNLPPLHVPLIGNKWAVGGLFLLHVLFGSYTMGTLLLGPTYELVGRRRQDERCLTYARGLAEINLRIFSVGATLAGFAVIFLTALYGRLMIPLVEIFFIPFAIALTIWIPTIAALYLYVHHGRDRFGERGHVLLGYGAAFGDHIFLFFIVGIDSFLLTPGTGSGIGAFFNPTFFPELLHRFVGNMSWSSFLVAAVYAGRAGFVPEGAQRAYRLWAAKCSLVVGFLLLVPQALIGVSYVVQMKAGSPGAFTTSFVTNGTLWVAQISLLSLLLFGSSLYFAASRPGRLAWLLSAAVVVCGVASALPNAVYGERYQIRLTAIAFLFLFALMSALRWRLGGQPARDYRPLARAALTAVGVVAVVLFLLMGVILTTARDPYAVFGKLTQQQAQGIFSPGKGHYP